MQQRGAAVLKLRKLSSAASAAKAIIDHARDWVVGTPEVFILFFLLLSGSSSLYSCVLFRLQGEFVSMAVYSDGSYGVKEGLIYSFPVTCKAGKYTIVKDLPISDFSRCVFLSRASHAVRPVRIVASRVSRTLTHHQESIRRTCSIHLAH